MKTQVDQLPIEPIRSQYVFESDFYAIKQWTFALTESDCGNEGYNECFCLVFVNHDHFAVDLATQHYELHTGHVVVEKADYTHRFFYQSLSERLFNVSRR